MKTRGTLLLLGWLCALGVHAQTNPFPQNKTYPFGLLPSNRNAADASAAYATWKTNFLAPCSNGTYRVKFDNSAQTVSEGIGYGMLLSAYAGDKSVFDGLWNFYKNFRNSHGVMHWKIDGCTSVIGSNGATDSEVDAAMALIVANSQWPSGTYAADAKTLIAAIKNFEVEAGSLVLKPGDMFGGSNLTNPSYFATGYFRAFGQFTNDATFWNGVAAKAYQVINANLSKNNAAGGLVSDWTRADGSYSSDAGGYVNGGTKYTYDAARTPWRVAVDYVWYGSAEAKAYSQKASDFVRVTLGGSRNIKDGYNQNGTASGQWHNSTFVGAFASAAMGGGNQTHLNDSYTDLKNINDANSYFNQTLKTLYLYLLTGNFYLPGQNTTPPVNNPPTVSISAPANNATYNAPASITLTASASDADGSVSKVEFFNGSVKLGEDATSPYTYTWSNVAAGTYSLTAKATDNGASTTTSTAVSVKVNGTSTTSPVVSLTSPANNTSIAVGTTLTLTASASDADGSVQKVEFYQGSTKLGEDATSPYSFAIAGLPVGTYTFSAKAIDNAGAVGTSSVVSVQVASTTPTPSGCTSQAYPAAAQYVVRNAWSDNQNGSGVFDDPSGMRISHRAWGMSSLWVIQSGKSTSLSAGKQYEISFDFKNDAVNPVTSLNVGFASSVGNSGPVLAQPAVAVPSGYSASSFSTKTIRVTTSANGPLYLGFQLNWPGQPNATVTTYIKNINVCEVAATATQARVATSDALTVYPNPFVNASTLFVTTEQSVALQVEIIDLYGSVRERINASTNQEVAWGASLPSGNYVIKVSYEGKSLSSFAVKN